MQSPAAIARPRLSFGQVRSFVAHVGAVGAVAVCSAVAVVAFAAFAPTIFAAVAAIAVIGGAAIAGGFAGDAWYHWARGERSLIGLDKREGMSL